MVKKTVYYYFSSLGYNAVFESQVCGWLKLYQQEGLGWHIIRTFGVRNILTSKTKRDESSKIQADYNIPVYTLFFFPDRFLMGRFLNLIILIFKFSKDIIRSKKIVIQTRSLGISLSLRLLKWVLNDNITIILDSRGAYAEEYEYNSNLELAKNLKKYHRIKKDEKANVLLADIVFCVSKKLRDYHIANQPQVEKDKFIINPCNADSKDFYFSVEERNTYRRKLGITNQFVICYSGGLGLSWQKPEVLFNFFSQVKEYYANSYFLILTSNVSIAQHFLKKQGFAKSGFNVLSVANNQVKGYLCASDLGVLFRDNVPMNNVASPTKFAEYLMCGLPVAISNGVGDFTEIIEQNKWGIIYNNKILKKEEFDFCLGLKDNMGLRRTIISYANENYSKQSRITQNINIYKKI